MNNNIILTIIEFVASTVVEGLILSGVFSWISSRSQAQQQEMIAQELNNIEKQNKFDYQEINKSLHITKTEIINQIKESSKRGE